MAFVAILQYIYVIFWPQHLFLSQVFFANPEGYANFTILDWDELNNISTVWKQIYGSSFIFW